MTNKEAWYREATLFDHPLWREGEELGVRGEMEEHQGNHGRAQQYYGLAAEKHQSFVLGKMKDPDSRKRLMESRLFSVFKEDVVSLWQKAGQPEKATMFVELLEKS